MTCILYSVSYITTQPCTLPTTAVDFRPKDRTRGNKYGHTESAGIVATYSLPNRSVLDTNTASDIASGKRHGCQQRPYNWYSPGCPQTQLTEEEVSQATRKLSGSGKMPYPRARAWRCCH